MKLLFVRHGETLWNAEKRIQGFSDVPLSDHGRRQAEDLARHLRESSMESIISSPLLRARETAQTIAKFHDLAIALDPDLRELNQGCFEGKTYAELVSEHAPFLEQWRIAPTSLTMPGGESLSQLQERAWHAVERVIRTGKDALVVSHSFAITTILCRMRGFTLDRFRETRVDLASLTVVDVSNGAYRVVVHNDISHLRE